MIKKLTKHGNSFALVIDRSILDLLNIGVQTALRVFTNGKGLMIFPAERADVEKDFEESLQEVNEKYGTMLKNLSK